MKDNNNNSPAESLGVWNDPELEARLVAMLMGELSPFEEAEMEQELERSPELRLFKDRMLEVKSLITEVNQQGKQAGYEDDWSLSSERRSSLLENFAEGKSAPLEPEVVSTNAAQWKSLFSIAACLLISLAAFMMMFLRKGAQYMNTEILVSYSAGGEESVMQMESASESDKTFRSVSPPAYERERAGRKSENGLESEGEGKGRQGKFNEPLGGNIVVKPEMSNEVAKKPSSPSSSMSKSIVANIPSSGSVPLLEEQKILVEQSLSFGDGDDFGSGWGNGDGNGSGGGRGFGGKLAGDKSKQTEILAENLGKMKAEIDGIEGLSPSYSSKGKSAEVGDEVKPKDRYKQSENFFSDTESTELGYLHVVPPAELIAKGELSFSGGSELVVEKLELEEAEGSYAYWTKGGSQKANHLLGGDVFSKDGDEVNTYNSSLALNLNRKINEDLLTTQGLRSGDYGISRESIDSFLNKPNRPSGGEVLVERERARRGREMADSDESLLAGRQAYAEQNYEEAVNKYKKAITMLPPGEKSAERRREYAAHLLDGSIALSQQFRRVGKYEEARELLDNVLETDPGNVVAKKHLKYLDDPIRTSPTLTHAHVKNVEKVRKLLYRGHSYYDQAQFDHATEEFKEILRLDPYNKAARRGMEKVAAAKSDYYRTAYDQTRASMLEEVDQAWELAVPPVIEGKTSTGKKSGFFVGGGQKMDKEFDELTSENASLLTASKKGGFKSDFASEFELPKEKDSTKGLDQGRLARIQEYKKKRKAQEDKVEDHRTALYGLSKKLGIPYYGKDGKFSAGRDLDANEHSRSSQVYEEAKRSKDQLESFVNSLNGLDDEDMQTSLIASGRPEAAVLKADFDQLNALKQRKAMELAKGLGNEHRVIKGVDGSIKEIEGRLERSMDSVRKKLAEDLVVYNRNVEELSLDFDEKGDALMVSAEENTRFDKMREDYEREQAILDAMKQAEFTEALGSGLDAEPEKATADFSTEISVAEQTHSTFSLNVSDVSYKLAKSMLLEKGGMPEASKIRVEEFVNAFDYGDPSACGKKVNCVVEQCAHPFYQQRNLMRIGMKTGAIGRSQPLRLTVLLDNSGSMEREDRAETVVKAMAALASQLGPQDEVTLLSFARGARLVAQKVKGDQANQLVNLVKSIPSEGGTNLSLAIEQAYATAQQSIQAGTMSRIVLITDGAANLGNADPEDLSKSIEKMRQNGIAFDACGVGADGLDDDMLEALTRKGDGRYYFINKPEDADSGFAQKLAGALRPAAKNVKVQVVFNPERVGNYRLIGFEKHRLEKQDFRNDAVDAAEMAAEEAGNALYQVEAKPDGKGDVGTVFVRFRDMQTGQMVERSWSIPYQPSIKSISSAQPSMQLAAVAGMLGERLKLGDKAGIELNQLSPVFGKLRSHFHADKEVKDLLRMCEKVNR